MFPPFNRRTLHHDVERQRTKLATLLGRCSKQFPGTQPVSFARKHFLALEDNDYLLLEKTDGLRCLLYFTQDSFQYGEPERRQFLIDRKNNYYSIAAIDWSVPDTVAEISIQSLHKGTILDGELVQHRDTAGLRYSLRVFDCLAVNGVNLTHLSFLNRRQAMKTSVFDRLRDFQDECLESGEVPKVQLVLKPVLRSYRVRTMLEQSIPKLSHDNDGIIFVCQNSPYRFGTDEELFKWKPPSDNTVDFRMKLSNSASCGGLDGEPVHLQLLIYHGALGYRPFADMHLSPAEYCALAQTDSGLNNRILECVRDRDGKWRPKLQGSGRPRFRHDKKHGNHVGAMRGIMESIEDAITSDDLIGHARVLRSSWKKRNASLDWTG